ncbi:MAG TPA: carboxylesterase family protein [Eoetvoesiella sp.]
MMAENVTASSNQGTVVGIRQQAVSRFSAIPFGQAPVGALRFKAPVPAEWHGTLDATKPGPVAPQLPSRLARALGDFVAEQSEDCLHLTVWTPAADAKRRPVVVWLHGGAWQSGGGAIDWYCGARLAEKGDVVVVAPNYRLGALGWLYVPGQVANLGLLDQEAAIDWVIENIQNFGGDPEQITVMGQSAGASSIACLLARQPKFKRAILQSASLGRGFWPAAQGALLGELILEAAGATSLEHARRLPHDAFLAAQQAAPVIQALSAEKTGRAPFCPVVDGEILPLDLDAALQDATGKADILIGYTLNEMAAFPGWEITEASQRAGDEVFGVHSRQWAADALARGRNAWVYRFDYAPTKQFGACHCIELPFVFDTLPTYDQAPMLVGAKKEDMAALTTQLQAAWIEFIRGGSPLWQGYPYLKIFK